VKIEKHVADGGALIASHKSGMSTDTGAFILKDIMGLTMKGDAPYSPDFILPQGDIGRGLPATEHVMYMRGTLVTPLPGTKVLAQVVTPYFNRTPEVMSPTLLNVTPKLTLLINQCCCCCCLLVCCWLLLLLLLLLLLVLLVVGCLLLLVVGCCCWLLVVGCC